MNKTKHCSKELAIELKKRGLGEDSEMVWMKGIDHPIHRGSLQAQVEIEHTPKQYDGPALDCQELGEILLSLSKYVAPTWIGRGEYKLFHLNGMAVLNVGNFGGPDETTETEAREKALIVAFSLMDGL